jgi:hypothetical protein
LIKLSVGHRTHQINALTLLLSNQCIDYMTRGKVWRSQVCNFIIAIFPYNQWQKIKSEDSLIWTCLSWLNLLTCSDLILDLSKFFIPHQLPQNWCIIQKLLKSTQKCLSKSMIKVAYNSNIKELTYRNHYFFYFLVISRNLKKKY